MTGVFLMGALTGCSGQLSNEYITIKQYEKLEVAQVDETEVTDDSVTSMIDAFLTADAEEEEITDRTAEEGDTVNIDYVGKVDGTEFDGGSAQGAALELGSGSYIGANGDYKGFEEQIVGHKAGDQFDLTVKFPDDYTNADMAGKVAVFTTTVNKVYTLNVPELTDEWVAENSVESKTVDEYKDEIKEMMSHSEIKQELLDALTDQTEAKKYPEEDVQEQKNTILDYYQQMAAAYNMEYADLLSTYLQMTEEDFDKTAETQAQNTVKKNLAVQLVAEKKKLTVTDEEYQIGLKRYAARYGYTTATLDQFEEQMGKDVIEQALTQDKVLNYLMESCIQVEQKEDTANNASSNSSSEDTSGSGTEDTSSEDTSDTADTGDTSSESSTDQDNTENSDSAE